LEKDCLQKKKGSPFSVSSKLGSFSKHIQDTRENFRLRIVFHCLGISVLGAALFLQSSVLSGIFTQGYFVGVEKNPIVLYSEMFLTAMAFAYLVYLLWRFVISKI
jgi:hypothetical protein